ncbi:MAG TPA: arsenic efflux protein [Candidatus Coproplasma avicola]|uniref:Arsenic efflux protein n=1 Tax=Candidatus Coproplasma avicola TaxID=2840744 RepID=A0A9D1E5C1_9FIRM|nr:arsenic efflux protein [Candidatus Coproplasma avicola]
MEVFIDSILDTLKVFPFILVIYILIEFLEHKTSFSSNHRLLQGKLAPLIGTVTGIIPQCGFSVMAAKLYDKKYIRTGTLIAVFLATSDEALIVLIVNPAGAAAVAPLIAVKVVVGLIAGYAINFILRNEHLAQPEESDHEDIHAYSCGREHDGKSAVKVYFVEPLLHSLKVALYIFVVTLIFGYIFEYNEAAIISSFVGGPYVEPLITAAIGLIPNCASSAVIAQTYCEGGIMFGSMVAGLCCNAGLGFVVLLKDVKKIKRNLLLIVTVYAISVLVGIAVNGICIAAGLY